MRQVYHKDQIDYKNMSKLIFPAQSKRIKMGKIWFKLSCWVPNMDWILYWTESTYLTSMF